MIAVGGADAKETYNYEDDVEDRVAEGAGCLAGAAAAAQAAARTLPGPGGEVCATGEDAHVDADLSDQHVGAQAGDAGDRLQ
jgi:hypothetical protein